MSANDVPEDLLPQPIQGKARTQPSPAAARVGATMPRPGGATITPVVPTEAEPSAAVIDLRSTEPAVSPPAPKKRATSTSKPKRASSPKPPSVPIQLAVTIPESLLTKVDDDSRSRADLLRDAFGNHAKQIAEAHPPPSAKPAVEGMRQRSTRRSAPSGDSFCEARFRLHPDEVDALDHWRAKTPMTRSAFVTELLKAELD